MRIILRADGNSQIGLGHVMRLLALADMLMLDFSVYFAIQAPTPALTKIFAARNLEIIPLLPETNLEKEADWLKKFFLNPLDVLVLDGYGFDTIYQERLKPHVAHLFCLDDIHAFPFVADFVINPAGGVTAAAYELAPNTTLLTGPDYALLQAPFLAAAQQVRQTAKMERIFINSGGADPQNHTQWIIEELIRTNKPLQLEVVVGSAYKKLDQLKDFIKQNSHLKVNLHQNLSAGDMCRLMQICEAAICPPSTVAYEWCCISGPLFIHRTAENQKDLESFLLQEKLAFSFGQFSQIINQPDLSHLLKIQAQQQRKYFHGQSKLKWRELFFKRVYPTWISFRVAQQTDSEVLFNWINEPEVRLHSLNPAPVPLEIHLSWFRKKIQDENSFIFIAEIGNKAIGMIRFDLTKTEALISYLLDKNYRGKGLGTVVLNKGIKAFKVMARGRADKVAGLVQKQNISSVKAFEKAGFIREAYNDSRHPYLIKFSLSLTEAGAA